MAQFGTLDLGPAPTEAPDVVSKKGLAELLEVHPSRITQLIAQGLPLEPNGRVSVSKARAWIADHVDPQRRKMLRPAGAGAGTGASAVRVELDSVRVQRARLELARQQGQLVDRQQVETAVFARARAERDAHMAWVTRVAPVLALRLGADQAVVHAVLEAEMRRHLEDLAGRPLSALTP